MVGRGLDLFTFSGRVFLGESCLFFTSYGWTEGITTRRYVVSLVTYLTLEQDWRDACIDYLGDKRGGASINYYELESTTHILDAAITISASFCDGYTHDLSNLSCPLFYLGSVILGSVLLECVLERLMILLNTCRLWPSCFSRGLYEGMDLGSGQRCLVSRRYLL